MKEKTLFIGQVARQTGINPKTIRYYEEIGLLPKPRRGDNNYRIYSEDTVIRIKFIKKAKSLGFTLKEIKEILALRDRGFKPCSHVRSLLKQRIFDVEQKISELTALRAQLKRLQSEWERVQTLEDSKGEGICPQIERVVVKLAKRPFTE
jgi:MerR family copper efflux transcriptional regulator